MKVTVLIENTTHSDLVCEHGLSLLIEYNGKRILLDAGTTDQFAKNAKQLGQSLKNVDFAILSHGHYDHSGGFTEFFKENDKAKVYARTEIQKSYFSGNGGMHEIGVPEDVLNCKERFEFVSGRYEIVPGVVLVPHATKGLEAIGEKTKLYKKEKQKIVPDDFLHEQSLVFELEQGLVICNSCSHGGAANIIKEVREACGNKPIYAYVGGLHMKGKVDGKEICSFTDLEMEQLCQTIKKEKISYVYTGHCTGGPGVEILKQKLGEKIEPIFTGMKFTL